MTKTAIAKINTLDRSAFVELLGALYEHSSWAAEKAFTAKPFADEREIGVALAAAVDAASEAEQVALVRAHPELAGEKLRARAHRQLDVGTGQHRARSPRSVGDR